MVKINKSKIYALFVDLKAAFDTVRLKGIYVETKSRIRTAKGMTEEFWTTPALRKRV